MARKGNSEFERHRRKRIKDRAQRIRYARHINSTASKKLAAIFTAVMLILIALLFRITYINVKEGDSYRRSVMLQAQQSYSSRTIRFRRGDITDRNGTLLATSEKVYNVVMDCVTVNEQVQALDGSTSQKYLEPTVRALVDELGLDEEDIRKRLRDEDTKNSRYQVLKKGLSINDKQTFERYENPDEETRKKMSDEEKAARDNIQGITFEEDYLRIYPLKSLASNLIGFTYDGTTADWGLEGYYSDILNGTDGRQYGYLDQNADAEQTIIPAEAGRNVGSTIDVNIEQIIRDALVNFEEELSDDEGKSNGAKNVGVVIMDPDTGEVLGMDTDSWFDLNKPRDLSRFYTKKQLDRMSDKQTMNALNNMWANFCISNAYEPGSVFKPFTVAAALSVGGITKNSSFFCDGGEQVEDYYIQCEGVHGSESLRDAVKYSCNDALMQIGRAAGGTNFLKYNDEFNFGMKTGIDLPGEASGLVYDTDTLGPVELATCSFGQGFTETMIQQAAATCAAINGGYYYRPHVVREITDENGAVTQTISPVLARRVCSEDVSAVVRDCMAAVLEQGGTGHTAKIPGYTMGGKTATAEKLPRGNGKYVVSYVGFAPLDHPKVVVYVTVDEPNDYDQERTAYPISIARNIFTELLPYMNIFPDEEGYTAANVDNSKVSGAMVVARDFTDEANGVTYTKVGDGGYADLTTTYPERTPRTDSEGKSRVKNSGTVDLVPDLTVGTAKDGRDLPRLDLEKNTAEWGNDYFGDGNVNEDGTSNGTYSDEDDYDWEGPNEYGDEETYGDDTDTGAEEGETEDDVIDDTEA